MSGFSSDLISGIFRVTAPGNIVWCAPNGNDNIDAGRGLITRPFLTLQAALDALKSGRAPVVNKNEFEDSATIFLAGGIYSGINNEDIFINTKSSIKIIMMNATINSPLNWKLNLSERFNSVITPVLEIIDFSQRMLNHCGVGNGVDSIKISSNNDPLGCRIRGTSTRFNGKIQSDNNYQGSNPVMNIDADSCTFLKDSITNKSIDCQTAIMNIRESIFTGTIKCRNFSQGCYDCNFYDNIECNTVSLSITPTLSGSIINCGFIEDNKKSIILNSDGILVLDRNSNFNLKNAGWSVKPDTVTVNLAEDNIPIVPI